MEDDGDRRNPSPPLPSTYVTLVQLQQRWIQEKQRKQKEEEEREEQERKQKIQKEREDEEKRKRQEEEEERQRKQKQKQANLQKRPVQSTATFPRRNQRPPLKSSAQFRAVGVSDGESKRTGDLKQKREECSEGKNWKMREKPRAEENLSGGKEQLLPEKEDVVDKIPVVSTERDYSEKERISGRSKKWGKNKKGKAKVEEDLAIGREQLSLEKEVESAENVVPVVSTERRCEKEIGGQCEEGVSASGGKRWNGRYRRGVKNRGNKKRVEEEDLITIGREEILPKKEVEAENVAVVVSTEREGGGLEEGKGKNLVVNGGRIWKKGVGGTVVDRSERVLGKFEGLSVRGGYGRNAGIVNDAPRRYGQGYGRGNSRRPQRLRDPNLVWVRKEEGDTSDANVAGV